MKAVKVFALLLVCMMLFSGLSVAVTPNVREIIVDKKYKYVGMTPEKITVYTRYKSGTILTTHFDNLHIEIWRYSANGSWIKDMEKTYTNGFVVLVSTYKVHWWHKTRFYKLTILIPKDIELYFSQSGDTKIRLVLNGSISFDAFSKSFFVKPCPVSKCAEYWMGVINVSALAPIEYREPITPEEPTKEEEQGIKYRFLLPTRRDISSASWWDGKTELHGISTGTFKIEVVKTEEGSIKPYGHLPYVEWRTNIQQGDFYMWAFFPQWTQKELWIIAWKYTGKGPLYWTPTGIIYYPPAEKDYQWTYSVWYRLYDMKMRFKVNDDLKLGEPGIYCIVIYQNATSVNAKAGDYTPKHEWCKWQSDLIKLGSSSSDSNTIQKDAIKVASISFEDGTPQATFVYGSYEEGGVSLTTILSVILVILIILLIFVYRSKK